MLKQTLSQYHRGHLHLYTSSHLKRIPPTHIPRDGHNHVPIHGVYQGCSVRFFESKGLLKFVKVIEPSNCLKGSMCNFGNGPLGSSPHLQIFPISCVWLYITIGGKKKPEWYHVIIVEQKKEFLKVQCKYRIVQILSNSEMCGKFGLKTKETFWPGYRLQIIIHI